MQDSHMLTFSDFNPHSREGSDGIHCVATQKSEISIHTPAKGVTRTGASVWLGVRISIHTPAKGVTGRCTGSESGYVISIHTPAKGVTDLDIVGVYAIKISIHTPAKGVTAITFVFLNSCQEFQSTLPRRE